MASGKRITAKTSGGKDKPKAWAPKAGDPSSRGGARLSRKMAEAVAGERALMQALPELARPEMRFALNEWLNPEQRIDLSRFGRDLWDGLEDEFQFSRVWRRQNPLVMAVTNLRIAFYNYGFRIVAADPSKADRKKIKDWWTSKKGDRVARDRRRVIKRWTRQVWDEWLTVGNTVAFWEPKGDYREPVLLPPEKVKYSDKRGIESLKFREDQIKQSTEEGGIANTLRELLDGGLVLDGTGLTDAKELGAFSVLKRAPVGDGFGHPSIASIFSPCRAYQSLQVGDMLWAHMGRHVYEQHKKGHEIKNGAWAGQPRHFVKKAWSSEMVKALEGKVGTQLLVTNFDHEITFPFPSPAFFDAKKFEGVEREIMLWGMPIAQMALTTGLPSPYLTKLLLAAALDEREWLGPWAEKVIEAFWKPPVPIAIEWDEKIFRDEKTVAQMLQFGLKAGPVSQGTFLRDGLGMSPEEEREQKDEEAELPPEHTMPLHDPDHGNSPGRGLPNTDKGGRPKRGTA